MYHAVELLNIVKSKLIAEIFPACGVVSDYIVFVSVSDGKSRAKTFCIKAETFDECWLKIVKNYNEEFPFEANKIRWLRIDWVDSVEEVSWAEFERRLGLTRRNYFRFGISLDREFHFAFLETELNANALLYGGSGVPCAEFNKDNFKRRLNIRQATLTDELNLDNLERVFQFSSCGLFISADDKVVHRLGKTGREAGRRELPRLDTKIVHGLIDSASQFLSSQVKDNGRFIYGWYPCFDREITSYNTLRHAGTLYSMVEAWEITRDQQLKDAIERSFLYLTSELIITVERDGKLLSFVVDEGGEIKLGGNALCILAMAKYNEVIDDDRHVDLMKQLGNGILSMQDEQSGRFVHVLNYPDFSLKQNFRIVYYDGEAVFALMRLYSLFGDDTILDAVEKAYTYFIAAEHWKAHDHWLSYATNELTKYRPIRDYFEFGLKNFAGYLDFVIDRITTFPTLLELMMAAAEMIERLRGIPELRDLMRRINLRKFYTALDIRAHYLLNGFFWPELAMFYASPANISGSFFIRHHAFRIRIDDVEHYLSGYCAYLRFLHKRKNLFANKSFPCAQTYANWCADDVAKATRGEWMIPPGRLWRASGLCIAAETFKPGQMIIMRNGNHLKGVPIKKIVSLDPAPSAILTTDIEPDLLALNIPVLKVPDSDQATLELGYFARDRLEATVFGVTGSAGKTTCVAMLSHALAAYGPTDHSSHNSNLPYGVAWNLASFDKSSSSVIVEMAVGRMKHSTSIARPNVAIFTNVQPAHLRDNDTIADIARTKSAIFKSMTPQDTAILNREMLEWQTVYDAARKSGVKLIQYGTTAECDFQLVSYNRQTGNITALTPVGRLQYRLNAAGRHMALNSLAILAAVYAVGHDLQPAMDVLPFFNELEGRGEDFELRLDYRQIRVIDDAYNANPGSMTAALERLSDEAVAGRRVAVMGEMAELGNNGLRYHTELASFINDLPIEKIYAVGALYRDFWQSLSPDRRGKHVNRPEELAQILYRELQTGDTVLVKGSHSTRLHELVEAFKKPTATMLISGHANKGVSALVFNATKQKLVYSSGEELNHRPAAVAKLITMCLGISRLRENKSKEKLRVLVSEEAVRVEGARFFKAGEEVLIRDLLEANSIVGANEASNALAEWHSGSIAQFVNVMNKYCRDIGMEHSFFGSPSGVGDCQNITLYDTLKLTGHIHKYYPEIIDMCSEAKFVYKGKEFTNINPFVGRHPGIIGLRTGSIDGRHNIIVSAFLKSQLWNVVVLGSSSVKERNELAERLLTEYC